MDPADLYRRSSEYAAAVIANVKADQLGDPTPCSDWNVGELLGHIVGGNHFFAASARGEAPPEGDPLGDDPAGAYRDSAAEVLEAFSAPGVYDTIVPTPNGDLPGAVLYGIAASEQLIHGWDIAKATGQDTSLDPELAAAFDGMIRPNIENAVAGGFYGPEVAVSDDASAGDRLVALVGRQP